jgi:hypothetical protein
VSSPLDEFIAAGPWPQRAVIRWLVPLARRPRALRMLGLLVPADQALTALAAFGYYDDPVVAAALGWDAEAVAARGRQLRRREGRP